MHHAKWAATNNASQMIAIFKPIEVVILRSTMDPTEEPIITMPTFDRAFLLRSEIEVEPLIPLKNHMKYT
jgi:hypothetical protein